MSDQEIAVKLSADVKSLLEGMKSAQEHTEQAVSGMKGDMTSLIASFEALGPAALAVAALGFAWEALKEVMDFIPESIAHTNELVESYHNLSITAGVTMQEFNGLSAAIQMSGGKTSDLDSIVRGMQRGIKANADALVDNGIAANKTALSHMTLGEYIAKVTEKMETYGDATDKDQLLMAAFGRSGMSFAATLEKLNANMAEGLKYGIENRVVTEEAKKATEELQVVKGQLAAAEDTLKASVAGVTVEYDIQIQKMKLGTVQWVNDMTLAKKLAADGKIAMQTEMVLDNEGQQIEVENWEAMIAAAKAYLHVQADLAAQAKAGEQGEKTGKFVKADPKAEAAAKAAHEMQIAMAKDAAQNVLKIETESVEARIAADRHLVAMGMLDYQEAAANAKAGALAKLEAQEEESAKELLLAEGNALAIQQINEKLAADRRKYAATIEQINAQTAERLAADDDKAAKQKLALAAIAAKDELNLQKTALTEKERALDQDLAFGRVTETQWLAMKKAAVAEALHADLNQLDQEQKAAKDDLVKWTQIQAQKDALNRKATLDMGKLETDAINQSKVRWDGFFHAMAAGANSSITGLIEGTMSWGKALQNVLKQGEEALINYFVQWGEQEAVKWATSLAMGETGRTAEATGAAAVYAVNAMGSVAAIPFYGWAMAPGVGAEAYAAGMGMAGLASAAGGWERVPADQVAMIHKNEQVLPANYAEGLRSLVANQGKSGGGGQTHVHLNVQAWDSRDVKNFLVDNRKALVATLAGAVRDNIHQGHVR